MAELLKNHVVKSTCPDISYPKCDLWTYLLKSFEESPSKIALEDPLEKRKLTFKQTFDLVEKIAFSLYKAGCHPDTPVCIYMPNCIEFVLVLLAAFRLGCPAAVINPLLLSGEIRKQLNVLKTEFLFCNKATAEKAVEASRGTFVKNIYSKEEYPGCFKLDQLYDPVGEISLPKPSLDPKQKTGIIPFSSGTTGVPKAVELTHSSVIELTTYFNYVTQLVNQNSPGIIYQPLSHQYGMQLVLAYMYLGKKTVIMQQFDLEQYISLVAENKVETLFFVPPLAVLFCKSNLAKKYDLSNIKTVIIGAAPLGKEQEEELRHVLNFKPKVIQAYGMTEGVCGFAFVPAYDVPVPCPQGSVGWPVSNTLMKVVDMDTGVNLGPNKHGEICMKSTYIMKGYLGNPEATRQTIDSDGWLHTGDIGYYDNNQCFFVVDRLKELIKYKGYQVSPSELEALVLTHPKVADAGVTSVVNTIAGELPCAWIVIKPGMTCSEDELNKFVDERVAPFKKLRGGIKFVKQIPKSPSGKILRRIMKEQQNMKSKL